MLCGSTQDQFIPAEEVEAVIINEVHLQHHLVFHKAPACCAEQVHGAWSSAESLCFVLYPYMIPTVLC